MKNLLKVELLAIVTALGFGEAFGQFTWTKDARDPILSGGGSGTWNRNVFMPCVLFNTDSSRYEMWFGASSGSPWHPYSVGFASSKDGITWTKYPSAVLSPTPSTWDAYTVEQPMVIRENGQYKMWYSSWLNVAPVYPGYIGYATSPDGILWTKYSGNPVMGPGTAAWEAGGPYSGAVVPFPGGYRMWYASVDSALSATAVGYATSADGITWRRDTVHNPVLKHGSAGQWDRYMVGVKVLQIGNVYCLWYEGGQGTSYRNIGVATSNDTGITWTKYANNPVLSPSPGTWYSTDVEPGNVLQRGDTLDMWYDGADNSAYRIGHATSPLVVGGITLKDGELPGHFLLSQNFPNPFNPRTTIKFELPKASHVSLTVYDLLGREISLLLNERRDAGVHEVKFDGSNLASGVYFYCLKAEDFVSTKKLVLLK